MLPTCSLDFALDFLVELALDFSSSGLLLAPFSYRQLAPLLPLLGLLVFVATCMSSDLKQAVSDLTCAVSALTSAVTALQSAVSESSSAPAPSDSPGCGFAIGIVSDSYEQSGLALARALILPLIAEDGPPSVPDEILHFAEELAGSRLPFVRETVAQAFRLGFWAKVAIETCTPYEDDPIVSANSELKHWIVLRSPLRAPFRVASFPDLVGLVDLQDRYLVVQSFSALYQLEAFCSGACIPVPPQWRPSKRD